MNHPNPKLAESFRERVTRFLFAPESDEWLARFRIGLGLQVLLYTFSLRNDWNYLLAATNPGLIGRSLSEALLFSESPLVPRLGWVTGLGARVGLDERTALSVVWWCLAFAGGMLLLGLFSRSSALLAWFVHLCAAKSGGFVTYGVDNFMTIGLFYLIFCPLPDRCSLDWRIRTSLPKSRELLGFWRRVLQLHLCLIYFFSGLTKSLGRGWWDGSNIWRALISPPFNVVPPEILVRWRYIFPIAGISVCLLEIGYPILIWLKKTRLIWLVCILAMHIGIGLAMGMYLFALIMIILNVAAFGPHLGSEQDAGITLQHKEIS